MPIPVQAFQTPTIGGVSYANLSASALVKTGEGFLTGVFVASTTGGTLKLWDNTTAVAPILTNTITFTAAGWYPMPFHFNTGLYATIGGTLDCTLSFT